MGVRQLTTFAGPLLAGVLIAVFGDGTAAAKGLCRHVPPRPVS
jgi:hypothetical protein